MWKIRLANERSCRRKEVGLSGAKDARHLPSRSDSSDQDYRDVDRRLHRLGERQVVRLGLGWLPQSREHPVLQGTGRRHRDIWANVLVIRRHEAVSRLYSVQSARGQLAKTVKALIELQLARSGIGKAVARRDRHVRADRSANSVIDREKKSASAAGVSAPLVGTAIAERRVELRDQIAVAAMNVDAVEAGRRRAAGRVPKGNDNPLNVIRGHFPRLSLKYRVLDDRRRDW